jgi:hypothetical protein
MENNNKNQETVKENMVYINTRDDDPDFAKEHNEEHKVPEHKNYTSYDAFLDSTQVKTFNANTINRDDLGELPQTCRDESVTKENSVPVVEDKTFWGLFPNKSIDMEIVSELFKYADNIYEKIIAICMVLTVLAVFNPVMLAGYAYANNDVFHMAFVFALVIFFAACILVGKKSFWIPGMVIIILLKLFPFTQYPHQIHRSPLQCSRLLILCTELKAVKHDKKAKNCQRQYVFCQHSGRRRPRICQGFL